MNHKNHDFFNNTTSVILQLTIHRICCEWCDDASKTFILLAVYTKIINTINGSYNLCSGSKSAEKTKEYFRILNKLFYSFGIFLKLEAEYFSLVYYT